METIWKFPLELKYEQVLQIPGLQGILDVRAQGPNEIPCLWAMVDPGFPARGFRVYIIGTGHNITEGSITPHNYLGSFHQKNGALVLHVFGHRE